MPEMIETPVTLADFAEAATPDRGLFLVVVAVDGVEQRLRLSDALGQILLEDLPADPAVAALTSALAGKADKASPFVDVASAATVDLGAASSPSVNITGTTTITSFGTSAPDGAEYLLKFAGALTVTHGASLLLPEATNLVTYAGMTMRVRKEASNVWRVVWYSSRVYVAGGGANRVKFDASALTANRTLTLPDANVDLTRLDISGGVAVLQDRKSAGTDGGSAVATTWTTRAINTEVSDPQGIVSLSSNQFTVSANCICEFATVFHRTAAATARIYNVTDGTVAGDGTSVAVSSGAGISDHSVGACLLTSGKTYRLEYYAGAARTSDGLGLAVGAGTEVYSSIILRRR